MSARPIPAPTLPALLAGPPPPRDWAVTPQTDHLFRDPANLDLGNDAVGVLTAVLTLLTLVLLADLCGRTVVRAGRSQVVSSRAVYRHYLFSRVANPLAWFAPRPSPAGGELPEAVVAPADKASLPSSSSEGDATSSPQGDKPDAGRDADRAFPRSGRAAIAVAGVALVAAELVLVFLTTAHTTPFALDSASLPALRMADPGAAFAYRATPLSSYCTTYPYTTRAGFVTEYPINMCRSIRLFARGAGGRGDGDRGRDGAGDVEYPANDDVATVVVRVHRCHVVIIVRNARFDIALRHEVRVTHESNWDYNVAPAIPPTEVAPAVTAALRRRGLQPSGNATVRIFPLNTDDLPDFSVTLSVPLRRLRLPTPHLPAGRSLAEAFAPRNATAVADATAMRAAWGLYIGQGVQSALALEGRGPAWRRPGLDRRMDTDGPLWAVSLQRPRLSVAAAAGVAAAVALAWVGVACGLGWRAGMDHRQAWVPVFEGMESASDLRDCAEQVVDI